MPRNIMPQSTKTSSRFFVRIAALLFHALLNFIAVTYLTNFDVTGSWLRFAGFVLAVFALFYFFLRHLFSFVLFLKNN